MNNIITNPLKRIAVEGGDVLHILRKNDPGYLKFGEVYASIIEKNYIKGWKLHQKMTLNLVALLGKVKIVVKSNDSMKDEFHETILSKDNYMRLTIPPKKWFAFQGIDFEQSILLNVADIVHDSSETVKCDLSKFKYNW